MSLSSTGNRCAIYDKIDGLDEARTVADLVARLRPILDELAYYAVNGEAAVMETREEWHREYTDRLYAETASERPAPAAPAAKPPARSAKMAKRYPPANSRNAAPVPPPANRPRDNDLPPSLRAIMEGTHPSLGRDEGYEG